MAAVVALHAGAEVVILTGQRARCAMNWHSVQHLLSKVPVAGNHWWQPWGSRLSKCQAGCTVFAPREISVEQRPEPKAPCSTYLVARSTACCCFPTCVRTMMLQGFFQKNKIFTNHLYLCSSGGGRLDLEEQSCRRSPGRLHHGQISPWGVTDISLDRAFDHKNRTADGATSCLGLGLQPVGRCHSTSCCNRYVDLRKVNEDDILNPQGA